uniref:Nuclear receptor coactivator 7 n=1 Tax=Myripristis murdjan TaxID=586833 RepID=A0A668ARJ1_9TELE
MEKRERKPGYFARLKRRRQLKQSQSEKSVNEQKPANSPLKSSIISCSDIPNATDTKDKNGKADPQGITEKLSAGCDDGCKSNGQANREKRRPPGTVEFIVGPNDSLNSIALKFNITPNKLVQLNKLFSRSVYPGQVRLFVPDVSQSEPDSDTQSSSDPAFTNGLSQEACHALRRELSPASEDESPATVKFIKMSCKYFTDGMGVVGGVMIVTPNNIMFDPHKSDPLVIEHGCEEYGLICPMEEVISVALYDDVSRMKLKDALPSDLPQDLCPVYRPGEWEQLPSERDLNPFSRYEALDPKRPIILDDIDSTLSETGNVSSDLPCFFEKCSIKYMVPGVPCFNLGGRTEHYINIIGDVHGKPTSREVTETKDMKSKGTEEVINVHDGISTAVDQSRGLSLKDAAETHGKCSFQGPCQAVDLQKDPREEGGLSEEERRKKSYEAEVRSWLLERMQAPIEDMLFSSEEKSKNPPMFLCFKVGKPMRKSFATGMTSSPAHSYGARGKQPEYWFAVPQERVDHLYAFFVQWSPDVYGKEAREQGFVVVEKDELDMIDNFFSDPASCSWEIITIDEAKRRQSFGSCDGDLSMDALPILSDTSDLLQDTHIEKLACRLPARVQGYPWRLAYSTVKHGTSLKTLYRNLAEVDSPVLLVIKDMDNQVFGAFSTHPFKVSEHCYGTGETFLYSFCPEIKVYRWTGDNSYFVKGNTDSLQMGGGGGQLGLWLDAELYRGTTTSCATFNNQPLSSQQDFNIHSLEVWAFE